MTRDTEKQAGPHSNARFKPTPDDDACFKLWNMYIDQAQSYDRALLEGWKSDMDGMMLFSALYSASLTALIIESYQTLQEDPADVTATVLTQMSRQLAFLANGTAMAFEEPSSFQLAPSAVVCNTLWFLSLALALTCSLLATFVQQWTRDFIHKTTMRPSPVVRARVLAFSYFGLRRFGMHTFVDVIPILLHVSLLFFFGGLVAFLLPVNGLLAYLMACVLVTYTLVYTALSCIPLVYLDAPYRTPVSDLIWRLGNMLHGFLLRRHNLPDDLSLTEAVLEASLKHSSDRDKLCMKYAMKTLNHDSELLPMFEAIPEAVISSRNSVRLANLSVIAPLLQSPDAEENIICRITNFISISGLSADPVQQEKNMQISLKALWSLARLVTQHFAQNSRSAILDTRLFWFDRNLLSVLAYSGSAPKDYLISTLALVQTSRLQTLKYCIDAAADKLFLPRISAQQQLRTTRDVLESVSLDDIQWNSELFKHHFRQLDNILKDVSASGNRASELLEQARRHVSELQNPSRWKAALVAIIGNFLSSAAKAGSSPFEMDLTHTLISSSIPGIAVFDQSIEIANDEAGASYAIQNISTDSISVSPELFSHALRLLCSTRQGLTVSEYRRIVVSYMYNLEVDQISHLLQRDSECYLEQCLLQDLYGVRAIHPTRCVTAIGNVYVGLGSKTPLVSPRLCTFAKQVFEYMPVASTTFTCARWWNSMRACTEWILCKDILTRVGDLLHDPKSSSSNETLNLIQILGQWLLPDLHVLRSPPPETADKHEHEKWSEDLQTYVMSMTLSIISKFIHICTEDTSSIFVDWYWMQYWVSNYSGQIPDTVQREFAKSVHKFVCLAPWNHPKDSLTFTTFHERIWRVNIESWCWITDVQSARMLVEAIMIHKNHEGFKGMIWREQELLDRCMQVVEETLPEEV
ncbi:hypothetical protein VKT23_007357 [Stygiomarasmius scandens]|uniref:DUF6535 domain-containing protein n=1 Tax=Marasmiellus scandens TaxID=2682957 RepID=A0ABR1JMF5_9AGAR